MYGGCARGVILYAEGVQGFGVHCCRRLGALIGSKACGWGAVLACIKTWASSGMLRPGCLHRLPQVRLSKWLTDLERNFYGSSMAYDKVRCWPIITGGDFIACKAL